MVYAVIVDLKFGGFSGKDTGTIRLVNKGDINKPIDIPDSRTSGVYYSVKHYSSLEAARDEFESERNSHAMVKKDSSGIKFIDETL